MLKTWLLFFYELQAEGTNAHLRSTFRAIMYIAHRQSLYISFRSVPHSTTFLMMVYENLV
jgi:hypothetical protein